MHDIEKMLGSETGKTSILSSKSVVFISGGPVLRMGT